MTAFRDASAAVPVGHADRAALRGRSRAVPDLSFEIYHDLAAVEREWRQFEAGADATAFQTFAWLDAYQRHVGRRAGVRPAIAVGRFADGGTALIVPLAVERRRLLRRLCWLGQDLCDYNAPLIARDFARRVTPERFVALWRGLLRQLRADPACRHDWIEFEKMPRTVGAQANPFIFLPTTANANSAHMTDLGADWETFYRAKRSSATRRRDRAKRRHMLQFGEVGFSTAVEPDEVRRTLDILWQQKKRIFARKGISDIFARPGYRELFLDFASNPATRHLAHVSRVDVGSTAAAANFAIVSGDCYYHVLSSYCDGQLAHYGPGALHLRELLAYAIGRGLHRFDFTIGDEHYKSEWCDVRLELHDYRAAATWRGLPASAAANLQHRLKRFVKQTPLLWHLALRLRAFAGSRLRASRPQASPD